MSQRFYSISDWEKREPKAEAPQNSNVLAEIIKYAGKAVFVCLIGFMLFRGFVGV